ncbi:MAG: Fic family protein [Croceimicrobium sp.]
MEFTPKFTITPALTNTLLEIERHKEAIDVLPINARMVASLRETARMISTHYSTQIEGNALAISEVEQLAQGHKGGFPGKDRDEREVRNYFKALAYVESLVGQDSSITEKQIKEIHSLVLKGTKRGTPYREGQNVIRDNRSARIVYMPPEAKDVPKLMKVLSEWMNLQIKGKILPAPIIAGLVHYQFATIHPYYDGNGRTARLLTTLLLHNMGYGLKGIYSLEEYYAKNLLAYYEALNIGDNHNYYMGRAEADVTPFLEYFLSGMALSFSSVRKEVEKYKSLPQVDQVKKIRELRPMQKQVLSLFEKSKEVSLQEIADHLGVSSRAVYRNLKEWIEMDFVVIINPSKKGRTYGLSEPWENMLQQKDDRL